MRLQQAFFNSSQGPQQREFRKEILQAMRVGVWVPTKRNWIPNFYRQCKLGWDNEINFVKISFLSHSRVLC
ncbi:TPA: nitrogen fixation protein NifR [Staphylococcus aureus]|nr:nitrogen fixation protein NifR [Staphylococcus aureus]RZP43116.1 nitrogen fixation protein NifR [Staphylococcus aureus]HAR7283504.1 nitrogen fixation protein NifR [Staphylococcus aureus]HAR7375599.1 nitrogen fixation protein NifR [Staphylococcus aureus]HAR7380439.1 nitrogen fixation protein NifR [Staphylococcus aureus]